MTVNSVTTSCLLDGNEEIAGYGGHACTNYEVLLPGLLERIELLGGFS